MRINREDMLELTRRMTVSRTSMVRIAGSYMDEEGFIDGTFNTSFLKLSAKEREKNLALAKTIPFSETNENLIAYSFSKENQGPGSVWQMLEAMKGCELKNDALMETFYELVAEKYQTDKEYAMFIFYDVYDVPLKGTDKERLGESEEVYTYLIGTICPLEGEYEPGEPECGFIYPMFTDRSSDMEHIGIYNKNKEYPHREIMNLLAGQ